MAANSNENICSVIKAQILVEDKIWCVSFSSSLPLSCLLLSNYKE